MIPFFNLPLWGRGFRPFFLLASLHAVLSLMVWAGFYFQYMTPPALFGDPVSWHAHEMIYGFTMAVVAGFLLTAVANWTGGAPARQMHLAVLCLIWLLGRMAMLASGILPLWLCAVVECAFFPALILTLSIPLLKSWNTRNFVFLGILSALLACDAAFFATGGSRAPLHVAVLLIVTMISLVGGRLIPSFTVAALRRRGDEAFQTDQPNLDKAALGSMIALITALMIGGADSIPVTLAAFASALIHGWRMRVYQTRRALSDPMLWILHAGYAWIIVGLILTGLAGLRLVPFAVALHALTAGAIGSMCLGMMCRVTLGHTGRNIIATKTTAIAFILMQLAGILRVFGVLLFPAFHSQWVGVSSLLWVVCFALYLFTYTPLLLAQRPDGQAP